MILSKVLNLKENQKQDKLFIYQTNLEIINMTYQDIKNKATKGYIIKLPNWEGYFKYNYGNQQLYFQNGDYYLNEDQIKEKRLHERNDWYYII